MPKIGLPVALSALLVLATGCSGMSSIFSSSGAGTDASVLHVEVAPPSPGTTPLLRNGRPLSLAIANFADARPGPRGRKLGDIKATVSNIHSAEMALDREVTVFLAGTVRNQLAADGFRIVGPAEPADFRIEAAVKAFSLNVADRDERTIVAGVTLRESASGDVIWSGEISERDDRYAGVTGNSRATLVEYLGEGVSAFAARFSAAVRDGLTKSYPRTIVAGQTKNVPAIPGVATLHAPVARDEIPLAPQPVARRMTPQPPAAATAAVPPPVLPATGHVSLYSSPARAKVYVGDVYYGVTPLKFELPAGVVRLHFRLDGYKPASEKVAVRRGEITELEMKLEKK